MGTQQAWHIAALFGNGTVSKSAWKDVQEGVLRVNSTATSANLMYRSAFCVVVYGPGQEPSPDLVKMVETIFTRYDGQFIVLSASTMQDLMERRARRMANVQPGQAGLTYESHKVIPVLSEDALTREENEPHMRSTVNMLTSQGLPFIEIYKVFLHVNFQTRINVIKVEMAETYLAGLSDQIDRTQKYIFTQSARAMQKAVHEPLQEWTFATDFDDWVMGMWIEQDEAQPFSTLDMHLKAVWIQPRHDPDYKLIYQVIVIDDLTRHQFSFIYHIDEKRYEAAVDYECRWGECQNVKVPLQGGNLSYYREPCEHCQEEMEAWIHWLHTTGRMLRKDFATSPDPQEWEERQITWHERKMVPRHHGKGAPKEKKVEIHATYSVVAYEVSERPPTTHLEEIAQHEKAQNWHIMHSKEDIIYERREVPASTREYRKDYWHTLKTEVVQAGGNLVKKVVIEGEGKEPREIIYTLEGHGEESYVIGTVAAYTKYFPMLRPELRKQQVVKKVTAKKYDE